MNVNDLTPEEYAKVRVLDIRIHSAEQRILARPVPEGTGNAVLLRTVEALDATLTPDLRGRLLTRNDRKMFELLAKGSKEELDGIDALIAERNALGTRARTARRRQREAVEAQQELERVRADRCPLCFTIHAGECA